jgi:hypothetical protein
MGPVDPFRLNNRTDEEEGKAFEKISKKLAHELALAVAMPFWITAGVLLFFAVLLAIL